MNFIYFKSSKLILLAYYLKSAYFSCEMHVMEKYWNFQYYSNVNVHFSNKKTYFTSRFNIGKLFNK